VTSSDFVMGAKVRTQFNILPDSFCGI
jgi:hypothetical protein